MQYYDHQNDSENKSLPYSSDDYECISKKMFELLMTIEDPDYLNISLTLYRGITCTAAAHSTAKVVYDTYVCWLLHTYSMLLIATTIYDAYHQRFSIDRSALLAGVLVHDCGGFFAFFLSETGEIRIDWKDIKLIGHSALGVLLLEQMDLQTDYPVDKMRHLQHITLSCGSADHGAAVPPQTIEAEVIKYLDGLDSRMDIYTHALSKTDEGQFSE